MRRFFFTEEEERLIKQEPLLRALIFLGWALCSAAVIVALCSCQLATHESHASATKWERDVNVTIGGTTHTTGADGWDNATDHNASFQVAAQAGGAAYGAQQTRITTLGTNASNNAATVKTGAQGVQNNAINHTTILTGADGTQSIATPTIPK